MTGFCEELRAERERRGVALAQLNASTKIQTRHLEALESGDFAALPGGVFRRGIVRAYLAAMGLEEEPWMLRFQQCWEDYARVHGLDGEVEENASWAAFAENVKRNRVSVRRSGGVRWLGVLLMLLLLLALGWAGWHYVLAARLSR